MIDRRNTAQKLLDINTNQKVVGIRVVLSGLKRHSPSAWARGVSTGSFVDYSMGAGNGALEIPLIHSLTAPRYEAFGLLLR